MKNIDKKRPLFRAASVLDRYLKQSAAWKHMSDEQRKVIERYMRMHEYLTARARRNDLKQEGVETRIIPTAQIFLFRNSARGVEVFLGKRTAGKFQGQWSAPGGKKGVGETFEDAALRELREETGLIIQRADLVPIGNHIAQMTGETEGKRTNYEYRTRAYVVWAGDLKLENKSPDEHTVMEWKPVSEALRMHAEALKNATGNTITPRELGIIIEFGEYRNVEEAAKIKAPPKKNI